MLGAARDHVQRLGDRAGALEAWRRALAISERLAEAHPDNVDLRLAPAIHLSGLADALDHGDPAARREAGELLHRALEFLRAAAGAYRLDATARAGSRRWRRSWPSWRRDDRGRRRRGHGGLAAVVGSAAGRRHRHRR